MPTTPAAVATEGRRKRLQALLYTGALYVQYGLLPSIMVLLIIFILVWPIWMCFRTGRNPIRTFRIAMKIYKKMHQSWLKKATQ